MPSRPVASDGSLLPFFEPGTRETVQVMPESREIATPCWPLQFLFGR